MKTFKDYLICYNNLDTGPFIIALKNFIDIYNAEGIDIFKDYVTLPGVARKMLDESSDSKFSLINNDNADLYYTIKKNIVGGPSIIFSRYHEKDVTNIKNLENNVCQAVVGYNCNGLYSYAIKQKMPTGLHIRRYADNNFKPEVSEKYIDSYVWMDYIMIDQKIKILHKMNNSKEIRIGNYLVDGFCPRNNTVYEYNGCYYHHCPNNCYIVSKIKNKAWLDKLEKTKEKDIKRRNFLISEGYNVITIQECEFITQIKPKCSKIYDKYLPSYYQKNKGSLSFNKIIKDVEYQPLTSFKSFIDTVTMHRIRGDQNPDKAIIGDTYKLLSNSRYGSVLMDRSKHTHTKYMYNKVKVTQMINSSTFKSLEELNNEIYEVESFKRSIIMDNPIQIGFLYSNMLN